MTTKGYIDFAYWFAERPVRNLLGFLFLSDIIRYSLLGRMGDSSWVVVLLTIGIITNLLIAWGIHRMLQWLRQGPETYPFFCIIWLATMLLLDGIFK